MTQRKYYESDDLSMRTQVLSCSPMEDGNFRVVLAATLFHPQGGGQPSDQGSINRARVVRVFQDVDSVVHVTDSEVMPGDAHIEVLADSRSLNARLHSAGHLIANSMEPLGWHATKGHHWPGEARVVFEATSSAQPVAAEAVEAAVNQLVVSNAPRHTRVEDGVRLVGFGSQPSSACGGTHVASTDQVGQISILKLKEKKGQLSIQYDVSHRAI